VIRGGAKHRILIVDDNRDLVDASSIFLELEGHACRTASNGAQALEEAARFVPDIVIVDIVLPGMSGYEVARVESRTLRTADRISAGACVLHAYPWAPARVIAAIRVGSS
jgi:CheY-like chemotaxis protein